MQQLSPEHAAAPQDCFGRFLVEKGLVSSAELQAARAYLLQHNQRLGEMAVDRGLLSPEQVGGLVALQKISTKCIGELAVEQGLLHKEQLDDLLFSQAVHSYTIGEALLAVEAITSEVLASALQEYAWLANEKRRVIWEALHALPDSDLVVAVACALELAFVRFTGQGVRIECVCPVGEAAPADSRWTMRFMLRDAGVMELSLLVSSNVLELLNANADLLPAEPDGDCARPFMEIAASYLCQNLEAHRIPVDSWAVIPCRTTPPQQNTACFSLGLPSTSSCTGVPCDQEQRVRVLVRRESAPNS